MGLAAPLGSVPGSVVSNNDSVLIVSGPAASTPPGKASPAAVASSSVPSEDPIIKASGASTGVAKLPKFPVQMYVRQGTSSRFELFFLNVKYGYDLSDFQFYNAWCLRKGLPLPSGTTHQVRVYNTADPNLPPEFKKMEWRKINYLINHKKGSKLDLQEAIWRLAKSPEPRRISPGAARLLREANLKGKDYTPAAGDLVAVVCASVHKEQPLFLEFKVPAGKPPVVKGAIFPAPFASVGGFASRAFIPPLLYIPGGGGGPGGKHSTVPEPSSLVLLILALAVILPMRRKAG